MDTKALKKEDFKKRKTINCFFCLLVFWIGDYIVPNVFQGDEGTWSMKRENGSWLCVCVCVHKGVFELQVTDFKNMFLLGYEK